MSVPMTLIDLERRDATVKFFRRIYLIKARNVSTRTIKFGRRCVFLGGHPRSHRKGRDPGAPIFEVPFYLCVHPCRRITKFGVVTHVGRAYILGLATPLIQDSGVPALPNFGGSPVFMPTPFNAERSNLAW